MKRIQGFPEVSSHIQTVVLAIRKYRIRFTYRDRTRSWYMDLRTIDDVALALGRRLSPFWGPILEHTIANEPEGLLIVQGTDGFAKADLGDTLNLIFIPDAEIPAATTTEPALVVVV